MTKRYPQEAACLNAKLLESSTISPTVKGERRSTSFRDGKQ